MASIGTAGLSSQGWSYPTWLHYIVAWMIHTEIQKWITRIIELDCLHKVYLILPGWPFLLCFDQLCSELSRKGCFCKSKIWLFAHHSTSLLRFLEQVSNLSQRSLETADSYSFMGDVCPVFTSPPLIPPNWSCLQRDSVSTHRRRHRITDLWVHPTSLRHRDNESNKFETLRRCIQPAWDLVRLSD